jgi:hypothetical protein
LVSATDLCSVFNKVLKDGWGVVPNMDGQLLSEEMLENIEDKNIKQSASKWLGKHVVDAGGLFAYAFRTMAMSDYYVTDGSYIQTIFNEYCAETGRLPKGGLKAGMPIFKKRGDQFLGIAMYVGNGKIIEARSSKVGVVIGTLNNEWNYWGKLAGVDYGDYAASSIVEKKEAKDLRVLRGPANVVGTDKPINVRNSNNSGADIIDCLHLGTEVNVLEDCGDFCKIQYLKTGYMMKKFLKTISVQPRKTGVKE